jgi:hypothetical protein
MVLPTAMGKFRMSLKLAVTLLTAMALRTVFPCRTGKAL